MRRSPLESAQATALPRLMAPDCCVMFSSFTHSQLFSDRPASRLITSHIVTQNPDIFTKASRLFVPFQTHVCSLSGFQHLRCPQQLSTFLKENSKLKKKKNQAQIRLVYVLNSPIDGFSDIWKLSVQIRILGVLL